ncbi:hypothetical protein VD0002_g10005 [Verticillium dahliae]|uniref:Uncharacterized protein n=1 Tax=Verticillium dahliae TaxID=27337 RepID=A0A2J8CDA2_VERDA|nr:U2 small nuclear ribonucleoprotein A [Verticillium dahliae VDG1]PNH34988.1 hypothetical protein BJF96_g1942 [Verticillium dahliae]PNH34989.1 hypothetical protein BJF96_g1943 [Verticillium dahliae]PNH40615.1 hypothetical protein VD0003_g10075 [Verticillium dahliae]PNH54263.1 hypothetical protein VD0002_g10005 [Verticillium dahliae]
MSAGNTFPPEFNSGRIEGKHNPIPSDRHSSTSVLASSSGGSIDDNTTPSSPNVTRHVLLSDNLRDPITSLFDPELHLFSSTYFLSTFNSSTFDVLVGIHMRFSLNVIVGKSDTSLIDPVMYVPTALPYTRLKITSNGGALTSTR